ncbi:MAG: PKD domain-containing protein, partial [Bacteroidia bacterium]|nr:PKD domain-containing protein [Bacteroidia bacterium]
MKKLYNIVLAFLLLTASSLGQKAVAQNNYTGFEYSATCLKVGLWVTDKRGFDSCAQTKFTVNGSVVATGPQATYTFPSAGTYTVCVKIINTCKKWDTQVCKSITVKSCDSNSCKLNPEFSAKNDCLKAKFLAGGNVSGATYSWSFGDGSSGTGKDPAHTYYKAGTYKVCLTMSWKDPNTNVACKKTVCREIKISCGQPCNIRGDFKFTAHAGLVKFEASSNNGYYYDWSFGDGTYGYGRDIKHQYKKPGTYNVCVKITDKSKKCSVTICKKVVIEEPCNVKATFAFLNTTGNTVKFAGIAFGGNYFVWSFGDGTSGVGTNPSHTYTKPGKYVVCLTVYSKNKKCKTTVCKTIEVGKPDNKPCNFAGASFGYSIACPKLVLEAKNLGGCINYGWAITPAGTNNVTTYYGRVQYIPINANGVYKVCLKLYDSCNRCDTQICKTIEVKCAEKCNWSQAGFTVKTDCKKVTVVGNYFKNCLSFGYSWGDGTYSTGKVADHEYAKNGTYTICMKVIDSCNNCDTIICKKVTVECADKCNWKAKYPNFTSFTTSVNCRTISAALNTISAGCIRQYYYIGGVAATYDGKLYHSWNVEKNGTYVICLKMIDTCTGCDTTICKEVVVNCNPCDMSKASFTYKIDCNKVTVEGYNMGGCNIYGFAWGDNSASYNRVADHRYTKNGTYTLCYKVYDTCNKCDTTICKTIKIDCQPCKATASFTLDSTSTSGKAYVTNTSTGAYHYAWDFGDSTFAYSKNPGNHAYASSGTYTICLTVWDSAKTCSTKFCKTIKIVKSRTASVSSVSNTNINVYPNPAGDYFNIYTGNSTGTYTIVNLQGK